MSLRKRTNLTDSEINQILFATPVEESEGESFELESEDEFNPPPEDVESDTYDDISVHVECEVFADAAFEEAATQPRTKKRKKTSISSPISADSYKGKDGTVWVQVVGDESTSGRLNASNVLREAPGPSSSAKRAICQDSPLSALCLFIDRFIIDHIVKCTQTEAQNKLNDKSWKTSSKEIYKLIGIMYARGLIAKGQPVHEIWSKDWGPPFFREVMSRNRYKELLTYIRFDLRETRSMRLNTDKFALFSIIWNRFIDNCKSHYFPNENITVDEQLFPTKARCPFTQYMASKPDKFGIKFWLAVDAKSKYLVNGFPYLGRDDHRPKDETVSEYVVLQLMEPYVGKGRNVTTDNFFTSVKLADKLEKKKTTIVGTMNRIRREIPPEIKSSKAPLHSTTVLKRKNLTLTVYQGKPSKNVLLLSSVHPDVSISAGPKKIPDSVEYYNQTKFGVDVVDQMARKYSTKVSSRRWPLQVFYNVFDLAAINALVLYREVTGTNISRREFLLKLITELKMSDGEPDFSEESDFDVEPAPERLVNCSVDCTGKSRNKTKKRCGKCKRPVCGKCISRTRLICKQC